MLVGFFVVFKSLDWRLNWVVSTNFHDGEERDASQIRLFPKIHEELGGASRFVFGWQ
jgi:hypothetical protein